MRIALHSNVLACAEGVNGAAMRQTTLALKRRRFEWARSCPQGIVTTTSFDGALNPV
jgi:hypothetical protein